MRETDERYVGAGGREGGDEHNTLRITHTQTYVSSKIEKIKALKRKGWRGVGEGVGKGCKNNKRNILKGEIVYTMKIMK